MFGNALIVADENMNRVDDRNHRAIGSGKWEAAHRHRDEKPGRLERNGFAAGVRSADDQGARRGAQLDRDRNNRLIGFLHAFIEQRMARVDQVQTSIVVE